MYKSLPHLLERPGQGMGGVNSQVTVAAGVGRQGRGGRGEARSCDAGAQVKRSPEQAGLYKWNVPHGLAMFSGA